MSLAEYRRKIDGLKQSISLRSLIESDGHKIIRAGGLDKCCCPFHREKTPSFCIYEDHGHCFGCDWHGDIFHYVMQTRSMDFKTAVESLGNGHRSHVRVAPRVIHRPKEPELPRDYFENIMARYWDQTDDAMVRQFSKSIGVTEESLDLIGVGRPNVGVWAFPMRNHYLSIIGIRYRDTYGKKWAERHSAQGIFAPTTMKGDDLYVTEGPTDCAAMLSMGLFAIGKAAAMQGPEEIVKFIQKNRIRRVIVIADNDTAGLKGAKKLIDVCPVPCCELVLPAKDAREFYRNGGTKDLIESLLKTVVWRHPKHA